MIYIASKIRHADKWKRLRNAGIPINSNWIDLGDLEQQKNVEWGEIWKQYLTDVRNCYTLIFYTEPYVNYNGVLTEVSAALAIGLNVIQVGFDRSDDYKIFKHPDIKHVTDLKHAFSVACSHEGSECYELCQRLPEELFI
jgi:hypothetical protein